MRAASERRPTVISRPMWMRSIWWSGLSGCGSSIRWVPKSMLMRESSGACTVARSRLIRGVPTKAATNTFSGSR